MIALLSRIFIKNAKDTENPEVRRKYGVLCGGLGIFLNAVLCACKLAAGIITGSIAVVADAFNNLSDAGSSVITIAGFRMAGQKPDSEHPFGHGRAEYIAGLVVSFIIMTVGLELLKSSVEKIITPQAVSFSLAAVLIMAASVMIKSYMFFYNRRIGKKIDSAAMRAAASDSLSDCIATLAVLLSMLISRFCGFNADGWCGIAVAAFIFVSGCKSVKETVSPLLGQPPAPEFVRKIKDIVLSYPDIEGMHDLIVHDYGPGRCMISVHAEVPADKSMLDMHDLIDRIEHRLAKETGAVAVIHMDPVVRDESTNRLRDIAAQAAKEVDERITIHDFRAVKGNTHTNLIFDAVVPFDMDPASVKKQIASLIHSRDESLYAVVETDCVYSPEH